MLPHDLLPWQAVYQQTQRWFKAGCFSAMAHDLRVWLGMAAGHQAVSSAAVLDSRTLQSSRESGARPGYDGAKRRKGSKAHMAVGTLGHLLALHVTPADEQDRAQEAQLAQAVQQITDHQVHLAFADQGDTGQDARDHVHRHGIEGGQTPRSQAWLRPAAQALGG